MAETASERRRRAEVRADRMNEIRGLETKRDELQGEIDEKRLRADEPEFKSGDLLEVVVDSWGFGAEPGVPLYVRGDLVSVGELEKAGLDPTWALRTGVIRNLSPDEKRLMKARPMASSTRPLLADGTADESVGRLSPTLSEGVAIGPDEPLVEEKAGKRG